MIINIKIKQMIILVIELLLVFLIALLLGSCSVFNKVSVGSNYFNFEKEKSPREIGYLVAKRFLETPHTNFGRTTPPRYITYPEVCTWYGALKFAEAVKDKELIKKLADRFEPLFNSEKHLIPKPDHVDHTVFGSVPLELYMQLQDKRYLELGLIFADKQWDKADENLVNEKSLEYLRKGLTWQTRMWIDDMFMITLIQTQAYRATKELKYIDRAAKEMVYYLDSLQQSNGLFYHAPDVPYYWGRGNGWVASGMTILLSELPKDYPNRNRILEGYKKMMNSLLKYQDENGVWHQLIDKPDISWPETSCSAMFTFAFIMGVKYGWLDSDIYGQAAKKGWVGLLNYINENGDIREVCEGTNKKNDLQYYLDRKRNVGDLHGQAPVLWCAFALLKEGDNK